MTPSRDVERKRLLAAREACEPAALGRWSDAITVLLIAHLTALLPRSLGFYWPHRREYDPMPVIERLIAHGWQVALPVVVAPKQPLEYRPWSPGAAMTAARHSFDIPHPSDGPAVTPDMLLAPLLGFDREGYRLGYGGGYFDRTLAAYAIRPPTVGIGYEIGRMETIDPRSHDIAMDMIVTELGIFPRR